MSIKANAQSNRITTSATLMLIEENALKVLLYNAYDELTTHVFRKTWFAITTAVLGAGGTGLIDWFCSDVATAESLIQFEWICTKSVVYGLLLCVGLLSMLIYWVTFAFSKMKDRETFTNSRMEDKSFMVINQPYQVASGSVRIPVAHGGSLNSIRINENVSDG